ncbi:MAG TPA: hypothetical protein VEH31_44340, partial [Streptosporangiaceae bacterium]|nr:hypothetical protein [Streptosporangiaceae bacterium]
MNSWCVERRLNAGLSSSSRFLHVTGMGRLAGGSIGGHSGHSAVYEAPPMLPHQLITGKRATPQTPQLPHHPLLLPPCWPTDSPRNSETRVILNLARSGNPCLDAEPDLAGKRP